MKTPTWSEQADVEDPDFVDRLKASDETSFIVAKFLQSRGYSVVVHGRHVRPSTDQIEQYADGGDLSVMLRVEVKRRSVPFTSQDDYPYPTILVDSVHAWDHAREKPYCYVIVNEAGTHYAMCYGRDRKHWTQSTRFNRMKQVNRQYYECPIPLAKFGRLEST